jgi:hypothetical protein
MSSENCSCTTPFTACARRASAMKRSPVRTWLRRTMTSSPASGATGGSSAARTSASAVATPASPCSAMAESKRAP